MRADLSSRAKCTGSLGKVSTKVAYEVDVLVKRSSAEISWLPSVDKG